MLSSLSPNRFIASGFMIAPLLLEKHEAPPIDGRAEIGCRAKLSWIGGTEGQYRKTG
jgi:hypothetical protein